MSSERTLLGNQPAVSAADLGSVGHRLAADAILYLHFTFVLFVIAGLVLIVIGGWRDWRWVRGFWFRVCHLVAIGVVVAQAWLGVVCPLTRLEMYLRREAGDAVYTGSFVAHWVQEMLYFTAPAWVFIVAYTLFGACVAAAWVWVRPIRRNMG